MKNRKDLVARFTRHDTPEQGLADMDTIRQVAFGLAEFIQETMPSCRESSLAVTRLEEAVFWANAGIARTLAEEPSDD